jgi:hypothetical protein
MSFNVFFENLHVFVFIDEEAAAFDNGVVIISSTKGEGRRRD